LINAAKVRNFGLTANLSFDFLCSAACLKPLPFAGPGTAGAGELGKMIRKMKVLGFKLFKLRKFA